MTDYTDLIVRLRDQTTALLPAHTDAAASAIEALLAERDALKLENGRLRYRLTDRTDALSEACEKLCAERDAALVDARRYRWLRDNHETTMKALEIVCECEGFKWDAAIDAAMQESSDEQA